MDTKGLLSLLLGSSYNLEPFTKPDLALPRTIALKHQRFIPKQFNAPEQFDSEHVKDSLTQESYATATSTHARWHLLTMKPKELMAAAPLSVLVCKSRCLAAVVQL